MQQTQSPEAGDIVRYSKPETGESDFRFIVAEHNDTRVAIRLICDWRIAPVETVAITEVEKCAAF